MAVDPEVRAEQKRRAARKFYSTEKGKSYVLKYGREHYRKNRDVRLQYEKDRYKREGIRDRIRNNQFRRMYGITLDQYNARLSEQGGVCAICRKPEAALYRGQPKMLSVDHDHQTGAVRGLLCVSCNIILGAARDDVTLLHRAVEYLAITGGTANALDE